MFERSTNTVLIAALTFRRPKGLEMLLNALEDLVVPKGVNVELLIVDNTPEHSAQTQLETNSVSSSRSIHVINEPVRGIANARNRVLDFAVNSPADILLMIDDDEQPSRNWLYEMLITLESYDADVAIGPVEPRFSAEPDPWMRLGKCFHFGGYQNGEILREGNTSNAAIKLDYLRHNPTRFDLRFDLSGGEDTWFFDEVCTGGGKIVFAKNALVFETIVPHRATANWLLKRWMRTGETNANIRLIKNETRLTIFLEGFVRMILGAVLSLISIPALVGRNPWFFYRNLRIAARGVGYLGSAMNLHYREYKVVKR